MKKLMIVLCMAMVFGCGNSPSTNSANVNNANSGQTEVATGGGKVATPPATPTPAAQANGGKKIVEVKFPKGATEASYTDSFVAYGLVEYVLVANADQQMTVEIMKSDEDRASFTVMQNGLAAADDASQVTGWSGILPQNGKYTISVGQVRASARKDNKPIKFTIRIRIV